MFVSEKIVYLELHKTGCTHIRNVVNDLVEGEFKGKHNQINSDLLGEKKIIIGSIRDPWEWYTSLWAYGCDRKGGVFSEVTKSGIEFKDFNWRKNPFFAFFQLLKSSSRSPDKWRRTYKDVSDAGAFREWLYMMHDKKYWNDFREGYGKRLLSNFAGLLTYRYLKLFCVKEGELNRINDIRTYDQLVAYEKENCFISYFIRTENLENDLFCALQAAGVEIDNQKRSEILLSSRTNSSSREHGPSYYYDSHSENLIAERERLIIEKFGYLAPSSRNQ